MNDGSLIRGAHCLDCRASILTGIEQTAIEWCDEHEHIFPAHSTGLLFESTWEDGDTLA